MVEETAPVQPQAESQATALAPPQQQGIGELLAPDIEELLRAKRNADVRAVFADLMDPEAADVLAVLDPGDRALAFALLPSARQADVFTFLSVDCQEDLVEHLNSEQLARLFNEMDPDDRAEVFEEMPGQMAARMMGLLHPAERAQTQMLLSYGEESVGRLMTTEFFTLKPEWTARAALEHVRRHGQDAETLDVLFVVDDDGRLVDDVRLRQLILADPGASVRSLLDEQFVSLSVDDDREQAVRAVERYDLPVVPVRDREGKLAGIVTFDDIADVSQEETTEDFQKMGGLEALDDPYLATSLRELFVKRGKWLAFLFVGGLLTASVMTQFEGVVHATTVLPLFLPLIIASGGNSGSQASTLIIRALAVGEVGVRDWWRVLRRELLCGLLLGLLLAALGIVRVAAWHRLGWADYTESYALVAATVAVALLGVVVWGTTVGAMLPFALRRLGFDPAILSAPLVATLVDVTGLVIYFTAALSLLSGTLL